jgi:hypothetical protein
MGWGQAHLIRLNNRLIRWRRVRVKGHELLLLAPHCLQFSGCPQNVNGDIEQCRRCGQCSVAGLLELRDRYGLAGNVAGGGRQALRYARQPGIRAVVAVACEAELAAGILAAFPRPVYAVVNTRPNGPCKDTGVDLAEVERAVRLLLDPASLPA